MRAAADRAFAPPPPKDALLLGRSHPSDELVSIRAGELDTGLHVFGGSGSGKTNFEKHLANQLLKHRDRSREGFGVVDPDGQLAQHVLDACIARGEDFADHVVYVSLARGTFAPIFNPLRQQPEWTDPAMREEGIALCTMRFVEAITKVYGHQAVTDQPLITEVVEKTIKVLLYSGLSLAEASLFVTAGHRETAARAQALEHAPDGLRSFWGDIAKMPVKDRRYEVGPAGRRFDHILDFPSIRRIVGQDLPGIDIQQIMDDGKILIVDLSIGGTGVTESGAQLLGALLVQEFRAATMRRAADVSRPFYLVIDEFADFVSSDVMKVFDRARKYGLRVILAHQGLDQLILKDQDSRLLAAVLRMKKKMIFGDGLVDDQLALARQTFARFVDINKRKLELSHRGFAPQDPELVELGNWAESDGEIPTESHQRTHVESRPDDPLATSGMSSDAESVTSGISRPHASSRGGSQAYITRFKEYQELSSVQFETADNQLFKHMQELIGQPQGRGTLVTGKERPRQVQVPLVRAPQVSVEQRARFMARLYSQAFYLPTVEADRRIEVRRQGLLAAEPPPPEVLDVDELPQRTKVRRQVRPSVRTKQVERVTVAVPERMIETPAFVIQYERLGLPRMDRLRRDLQQAEKFYGSGDWKECLLNARNILEGVLWDVASAHADRCGKPLRFDPGPKEVRDYLRASGFIDQDAGRMLAQAYGRQSDYVHAAGTPTRENALLWLDQAKSLCRFVLENFETWLQREKD